MNRSNKFKFIVLFLALVAFALISTQSYAQTLGKGGVVPHNLGATDKIIQSKTLGDVITNAYTSAKTIPGLVAYFAYVMGLMTLFAGILKLKEHVDNPGNTPISVAVKRLFAGGALLALPYMSEVVAGSVIGNKELGKNRVDISGGTGAVQGEVDGMIYAFVSDIYEPMIKAMGVISYIAAISFLIIGIMRLTKTAQDGPKGPSGIGTITTFIVSGALFAAGDMSGIFVDTLFGTRSVSVYPTIGDIVVEDDKPRIAAVISAIMAFINMVGFIAFLRGWFVLKKVADGGGGNVSLTQAIVFLISGAIAINLGQFINILQATVGVSGITFD